MIKLQTNTLIIPPSIRQITLERIDQLFHMNMLLTITEIPLETAQGQIEHSGARAWTTRRRTRTFHKSTRLLQQLEHASHGSLACLAVSSLVRPPDGRRDRPPNFTSPSHFHPTKRGFPTRRATEQARELHLNYSTSSPAPAISGVTPICFLTRFAVT